MKKSIFLVFLIISTSVFAQNKTTINDALNLNKFDTIHLIQADTLGGMPLLQTISRRKSDRKFEQGNLTIKQLSEILWVANGINRSNGKRTVPSSMAQYPLQTYAVMSNGIYFYNPQKHQLEPIVDGDYRKLSGKQTFVETVALNLVFIAKAKNETDNFKAAMLDSGYCAQNVYLYCASEGLKCVVRAGAQEAELLKVMKLDNNFKFIIAHTIGH